MTSEDRERHDTERVLEEVLGWQVAGALGNHAWIPKIGGSLSDVRWSTQWNPFRSATDDYEVLEWVREQWDIPDEILFADALKRRYAQRAWCLEDSYMKGDYAASALEVIDYLNSRIDAQETPG